MCNGHPGGREKKIYEAGSWSSLCEEVERKEKMT